jgi:hypothetical protein
LKNSKLTYILKSFTKDEFKAFEKFVNSPYYSTGRDVSSLFVLLKREYPGFNSQRIEKKNLFTQLFPDEKFNEKKLKNLSSDLTRLAWEFLSYDFIRNNSIEAEKVRALQFKNRNDEKLFIKSINILEESISKKLFNSTDCFKDEEELSKLKAEFYLNKNNFEKGIQNKIKYSEYYTLSFLIRFFRILREKAIIENRYNMPFESPLLNSVSECIDFNKLLDSLRGKSFPQLWLVEIYYYVLMTSIEFQNEHYYKLKNLFLENIGKFSRLEKYYLFGDLASFCIFKEGQKETEFRKEEFENYIEMLKQNAYSSTESEYLSVVLYRNILLIAISLKEFEWLKEFIKDYSEKLKPDFRNNMEGLAMANLRFAEGNFKDALQYIGKVQYDFFLYKLDVKNLMLKLYYEMELFEQAFSLMDTYRHYLTRSDEVSESIKNQHLIFLLFYSRLLKAKSSGNFIDMDICINEIENSNIIASRNWLRSKAEELTQQGK